MDLVNELLERSQRDLLVEILKERAIDEYQYYELAELLTKRKDPGIFTILMSHSEPIERIPADLSDNRSLYQQMAVGVLSHYLGGAPEETVAVERLCCILKGSYSSTSRGRAASSLGSSDRPESVDALLRALKDHDSVWTANGSPELTVAVLAEQSLGKIEKRSGRSIPRVVP